ncbi:hypothetical protein D9M71_743120 [compost metagenome]
MGLFQYCGDFGRLGHAALKQRRLELTLQLAFRPFFLNGHSQIELALFWPLALAEDDQIM